MDVARTSILVAMEGLMGAGKSSLLSDYQVFHKSLKNPPFELKVVEECLHDFTHFRSWDKLRYHNPLALSYSEPEKYSTLTELHITRCINDNFKKHLQTLPSDSPLPRVILTDRGLFSSGIFINWGKKQKTITEFAYDFLMHEVRCLMGETLKSCALERGYAAVFFLDVDPVICQQRIMRRGRSFEQELEVDTLIDLQNVYSEYFQRELKEMFPCCEVEMCPEPSLSDLHQYLCQLVSEY